MLALGVEELGFDIKDESEESLPGTEIVVEPGITAQPEAKKSKAPPWYVVLLCLFQNILILNCTDNFLTIVSD